MNMRCSGSGANTVVGSLMKLDIFGSDLLFVKVCAQINNGATFVDNFVTMAEVIESLPFFNRGF